MLRTRLLTGNSHYQHQSGIFSFLPIGLLVLENIERLVDITLLKHLNGIQKVKMPSLIPSKLFQSTGRWDSMGQEMFKLKDRKEQEFCLGPTHEEAITDIVSNIQKQNKSFPLLLYQMTRKFRDEKRPRQGLLRAREFVMKDLYSFHLTEECLHHTYENVRFTYREIFRLLEIPIVEVLADSGSMGGSFTTHEFQMITNTGEDTFFTCNSSNISISSEIMLHPSKHCTIPHCSCHGKGTLIKHTGIELGHTFMLGTRYSEALNAYVQDSNQERKPLIMGCYGLGISRILASCTTNSSDQDGIIWPIRIAPFLVSITTFSPSSENRAKELTKKIEDCLRTHAPFDIRSRISHLVLLDDRWKDSHGKKLQESRQMGIPLCISIGSNNTELILTKRKSSYKSSETVNSDEALLDYIKTMFQ